MDTKKIQISKSHGDLFDGIGDTGTSRTPYNTINSYPPYGSLTITAPRRLYLIKRVTLKDVIVDTVENLDKVFRDYLFYLVKAIQLSTTEVNVFEHRRAIIDICFGIDIALGHTIKEYWLKYMGSFESLESFNKAYIRVEDVLTEWLAASKGRFSISTDINQIMSKLVQYLCIWYTEKQFPTPCVQLLEVNKW